MGPRLNGPNILFAGSLGLFFGCGDCCSKGFGVSFLLPNRSEKMLLVLVARPFISELILEKKSLLAPDKTFDVATKEVDVDDGSCLLKESP